MNSIDILNAIGDVDDEYAAMAKLGKKSHKMLWITLGSSLAACLVLFIGVPVIFAMTMRAGAPAPENAALLEDGAYPDIGTAIEIVPVYADAEIFYVADGKICSKTLPMYYKPDEVFAAWREASGIGDEVELVKCEIKDNSTDTEKEVNGETVVEHTVGDYFILNVTISKNIEDYYDRIDSELLLDSLKQTMTGYSDIEFDEYHLILV